METEASATELSALLEQGKITSLALLEQYLARIEAHNPKLHAVLELAADAREQAARLDAERAQMAAAKEARAAQAAQAAQAGGGATGGAS